VALLRAKRGRLDLSAGKVWIGCGGHVASLEEPCTTTRCVKRTRVQSCPGHTPIRTTTSSVPPSHNLVERKAYARIVRYAWSSCLRTVCLSIVRSSTLHGSLSSAGAAQSSIRLIRSSLQGFTWTLAHRPSCAIVAFTAGLAVASSIADVQDSSFQALLQGGLDDDRDHDRPAAGFGSVLRALRRSRCAKRGPTGPGLRLRWLGDRFTIEILSRAALPPFFGLIRSQLFLAVLCPAAMFGVTPRITSRPVAIPDLGFEHRAAYVSSEVVRGAVLSCQSSRGSGRPTVSLIHDPGPQALRECSPCSAVRLVATLIPPWGNSVLRAAHNRPRWSRPDHHLPTLAYTRLPAYACDHRLSPPVPIFSIVPGHVSCDRPADH